MADQEKNIHEQDVQEQDTKEFETVNETVEDQVTVEPVNIEEATKSCVDYLHKHLLKEYEALEQEPPEEATWKPLLENAIGKLYLAHEEGGDPPTLEALVVSLRSNSDDLSHNMANVLETMERDPFLPRKSKKKLIAGIIIAVVAIALIAGGVAYALMGQQPQEETPKATDIVKVEKVEQEGVSVNVACEGWNKDTSTPIVLAIYEGDVKDALLSTDENVEVPAPINELSLNAGEDTKLEDIVDAGTYTLSIVGSPVLEDGTIFEVPDPQVIEYDGEKGQIVKFELKKKDASQVTEADIAAATAAATAVGADTGKVTNATNNTRNNASNAQGGSIQQGQSSNQSKPSGGSTGGGNTGSSSGGGNSGGAAQPSQPSQPTHTHTWVAQTTTITHPAEYKTVHHDAVTKEVIVCLGCGAQNPSRDHIYQHVISGGNGATTVKTVTVQAAYDEQVLVKDAWTETITTGYKCSGCGATK